MLDLARELVSITFYPLLLERRLRFLDCHPRDIFIRRNS
jgi:hypothetical protein